MSVNPPISFVPYDPAEVEAIPGELGLFAGNDGMMYVVDDDGASSIGTTTAWVNAQISAAISALTKSSVGLGNVDNTSDANKPVSTAQQTALDLKANIASPAFTGTPTAPTATASTNTTQIATTKFVNDWWGASPEKAKLDGIAPGATANSTDATLLARANHTGTQAISTITNLQQSLDGKIDGPASSTPDTIMVFGSATGKTAKNSAITVDATSTQLTAQKLIAITGFEAGSNAVRSVHLRCGRPESTTSQFWDHSYFCGTTDFGWSVMFNCTHPTVGGNSFEVAKATRATYPAARWTYSAHRSSLFEVMSAAPRAADAEIPLADWTSRLRVASNGSTVLGGPAILAPYTYATVPAASTNAGATIRITDRSHRLATSDGTTWLWTGTTTPIS